MTQDRGEKCIVKGCKNYPDAGTFVGVLCFPCWEMVTTGKISRGQTAFHDLQPAMNETLACQILGTTIREDNALDNISHYTYWRGVENTVTLDGAKMTKPVLFDNLNDFLKAGNQRQHTVFDPSDDDANPQQKKMVVLYHANCWDGITAAWCAWLKFKSAAVYIPVQYGKPLPNVDWSDVSQVYILDFSYQREILDELYATVNGALCVLDHHKTAEEQLRGAPYACFAKNLSGAGMAWLYFQERHTFLALARGKHGVYGSRMCMNTMPKHVYHAQDYDLWAFKDKETKAFRAAQDLYPREIATIQKIHEARVNVTNPLNVSALVARGKIILEQKMKMVDEAAANAFLMPVPNFSHLLCYGVLINNPSIVSELGNVLAERALTEGHAGVAVIFQVNDKTIKSGKVILSLRSTKTWDVSSIAKHYGGGGHAQASGCSWDYAYFLQFMGYLGVKAQKENT